MSPPNLLSPLPPPRPRRALRPLRQARVRIERIVSHRHASPPGFWYDQTADEWVMLAQGSAVLEFDDGRREPACPW